jgi:hypothetical protein
MLKTAAVTYAKVVQVNGVGGLAAVAIHVVEDLLRCLCLGGLGLLFQSLGLLALLLGDILLAGVPSGLRGVRCRLRSELYFSSTIGLWSCYQL